MRFLRIKKSKEEKCDACENHMTFVSWRWQRPASEPRLGNTGVIRVQGPRPPGSDSGGCVHPGTRVTLCPHGRHRTRGWGRWPRHARGGGGGEPPGQPRRRISRPGRVSGRRVVSAAGRGGGPRAVRGEWTPPPCPRGPPARALRATEAGSRRATRGQASPGPDLSPGGRRSTSSAGAGRRVLSRASAGQTCSVVAYTPRVHAPRPGRRASRPRPLRSDRVTEPCAGNSGATSQRGEG